MRTKAPLRYVMCAWWRDACESLKTTELLPGARPMVQVSRGDKIYSHPRPLASVMRIKAMDRLLKRPKVREGSASRPVRQPTGLPGPGGQDSNPILVIRVTLAPGACRDT